MSYMERYHLWTREVRDPQLAAQLAAMAGEEEQIKDSFYKDLEFGTAGL